MLQDVDDYRNYLIQYRKVAENSIHSYLGDVDQFVSYLHERNTLIAEEISKEDLEQYESYLTKAGLCCSTVARKIVSAKAFYRFLYRNHHIDLEMADCLKAPKVEKRKVKYLSQEEMQRLVEMPDKNTPKEFRDRAILELLYATGMRVSELTALRRENLDLQMDCMILQNGREKRVVPYGKQARDALMKYLAEARVAYSVAAEDTYIFLNHSGKPLTRQAIFKMVKKYGEKAKIEQTVTPDMIRHSFAKHLLENGAELSSVQKMMGHSSLSVTALYLDTANSEEKENYRKAHPRG